MEDTIKLLIENAKLYKVADANLEKACGKTLDPIACTIYARNNIHAEHIPPESRDAAFYLNKVVSLHEVLVRQYGMNADAVRAIWFPILNSL